jgi:hypothetical protein
MGYVSMRESKHVFRSIFELETFIRNASNEARSPDDQLAFRKLWFDCKDYIRRYGSVEVYVNRDLANRVKVSIRPTTMPNFPTDRWDSEVMSDPETNRRMDELSNEIREKEYNKQILLLL